MATAAASLEERELDRLCRALHAGLGAFGYQWLGACALYPRLRFALSGYLGDTVAQALGRPPIGEGEMLALYRLPWFRDGHMPAELRSRLIADMEPSAREAALRAIERALYATMDTAAPALDDARREPLLAPDPPPRWRAMLRSYLDAPPEGAAERDTIYVRAATGRSTAMAAVRRDRARARLLGWSAARLFTWRTLPLVVAVALLIAGWATADRWLRPWFEETRTVTRQVETSASPPTATTPEPAATRGPAEPILPVESDLEGSQRKRQEQPAQPGRKDDLIKATRRLIEKNPDVFLSAKPPKRPVDLPAATPMGDASRDREAEQQCGQNQTLVDGACQCPRGYFMGKEGTRASGMCLRDRTFTVGADESSAADSPIQAPPRSTQQVSPPSNSKAPPTSAADGALVLRAQRALIERKLYSGYADGMAGARYTAALRQFQQQQGLEPTGTLDVKTAAALGLNTTPN